MMWQEFFPWSNKTIISDTFLSPQVLTASSLVQKSIFMNIRGDSALSIINKNFICSIDYCSFSNCTNSMSITSKGCVHLDLIGYSSASITRTIGDSCSSCFEGNFAALSVDEFGSIFVLMTSVDKCSPGNEKETYHSILMVNGTQIVKNINNTRCHMRRHAGFSNVAACAAQVDFCNVVDNAMTMTCIHVISGNCEVRRVNYIRNTLGELYEGFEGLIVTRKLPATRIILSDCVLASNKLTFLISVDSTDITLIGCSLDNDNFKCNNGKVLNIEPRSRPPVTMTLMAGNGKHAEIPYGKKLSFQNYKNRFLISASLMAILSEGLNSL